MSWEERLSVVVIDLETTGTDPAKHQILEIGAKVLCAEGEIKRPFEAATYRDACDLQPDAYRSVGAAAVNGVWKEARDSSFRDEGELLINFVEWLGIEKRVIIAGINPHFDRDFLIQRAAQYRLEVEPMFGHRVLDLHSLALAESLKQGGEINLTSSAIYGLFGLEPERKPHTAEEGARLEHELFYRLLNVPKLAKSAASSDQPRSTS